MALFDSLLSEVNERFHLGDKGGALVSALFDLIINNGGGLNGFLELFRRVGLGQVADSWASQGANSALSNQQTEDALGVDNLNALATKAGLPLATATSALSFLIPTIVDKLTPNGYVPDNNNLRETLSNHLALDPNEVVPAGEGETLRSATLGGTGMPDRSDAAGEMTGNNAARTPAVVDTGDNSPLRWVLPLVLVILLSFVGYQFCSKPNQNLVMANVNTNVRANTNTATTAARIDPRLSVRAENGKYFVTGVVSSETEKNQIMDAMNKEFGAGAVDYTGLKVDPKAKTPTWLAKFVELVPSLKGWTGGTLTFEGENRLAAAGNIPQTIIDKIKSLFTGWTLPAFFLGTGADAQKAANEQAVKALETANTPEQVVDALNLSIINFATGKSDVPPDAENILQQAAVILKNAPAGTLIEVGGHTDNVGNAASNQKLSEDRANSVKNELVKLGVNTAALSAKGYGDTKPKADNTTDAGKFQNRRIEYTLTSASGSSTVINSNTTVTTTNSNVGH